MPAFIKKNYTVRHNNGLRPIHPGEILREEFLNPLFPSSDASLESCYPNLLEIANRIGISPLHLKALLQEKERLTVDDAFRLARYFGVQIDVWLGMQEAYDVKMFEKSAAFRAVKEIKPHAKKKGVLVPLPAPARPKDPQLHRATCLIRDSQDLISTNDPGQPLIRKLEAFLKEVGVPTIDEAAGRSS